MYGFAFAGRNVRFR
ncbi:MAG: hypothetical protein ACLSAH_00200 [Bilophila wadsworthia]